MNEKVKALLKRAMSRRENKEALLDLKEATQLLEEETRIYDENEALNKRDAEFGFAGISYDLLHYPR